MHLRDARDDTVGLPQALDEPGHGDDLAAVPAEKPFRGVQALGGDEDVTAPFQHHRPATEVPNREPDVVTGDGGSKRDEAQ